MIRTTRGRGSESNQKIWRKGAEESCAPDFGERQTETASARPLLARELGLDGGWSIEREERYLRTRRSWGKCLRRARLCSAVTWRVRTGGGARRMCPGGREQRGQRGCTRGSAREGRGQRREGTHGGGLSARREDVKRVPATCSIKRFAAGRGRKRSKGTGQGQMHAQEGSDIRRGG
jgi:hypothetical protein